MIRKMRIEDKPRVVEICKTVFGGTDYVPHEFEQYLEDPCNHFVAAEVEGVVVGTLNLRIIDTGTTGWLYALRVDPGCRGKGYATIIMAEMTRRAVHEYGVKKVRYSAASYSTASIHMAIKDGMRAIDIVAYFRTIRVLETADILRENAVASTNLVKIDARVLYDDLMKLDVGERALLVPSGTVNHNWKFFDLLPEMETTLADTEIYATYTGDAGRLSSFSISGLALNSALGGNWSVSIFVVEPELCVTHLKTHIDVCTQKDIKDFQTFLPMKFQGWLSDTGLLGLAKETGPITVSLFEK